VQEMTPEQVIDQLEKAEVIRVKQGPVAVRLLPQKEIFT